MLSTTTADKMPSRIQRRCSICRELFVGAGKIPVTSPLRRVAFALWEYRYPTLTAPIAPRHGRLYCHPLQIWELDKSQLLRKSNARHCLSIIERIKRIPNAICRITQTKCR